MTGYLHYNQGAMHFCSEDLSIARQCQSLHEDAREVGGCEQGDQRERAEKEKNPFCTLFFFNNYSNMKIITVKGTRLHYETNTS